MSLPMTLLILIYLQPVLDKLAVFMYLAKGLNQLTNQSINQSTNITSVTTVTRSQAVVRIADCTAKNCRGHVT